MNKPLSVLVPGMMPTRFDFINCTRWQRVIIQTKTWLVLYFVICVFCGVGSFMNNPLLQLEFLYLGYYYNQLDKNKIIKLFHHLYRPIIPIDRY